jgi:F420-non-reducing hydrogenase iron-sulfur subunit
VPAPGATGAHPRVLVFSTNGISDMGIDLAGSSHLDYPASVEVIALPCSSGINPNWILHALRAGFDGVFVAADGPECTFVSDCVDRTGRVVREAQSLVEKNGFDPGRVKMAAICSVCAEPFVNHMRQFGATLAASSAPAVG